MFTENYKDITKASYEATANEFALKVKDLAPQASIEQFFKLLPSRPKILDIGSGSGRDAKIFTQMGATVLGIDYSPNLIKIAKNTAPQAEFQLMDMEKMDLPLASFDGVWAACSLAHVSKKIFPEVLKDISCLLKEKGYFYLALKKGKDEILEQDLRYDGDVKKFWAFYEEEELRSILEETPFKILDLAAVKKQYSYQTGDALRAFCQKV